MLQPSRARRQRVERQQAVIAVALAERAGAATYAPGELRTAARECLDHVLFWNARDLERTLADFQASYNEVRSHASLKGHTPLTFADGHMVARAELNNVRWVSHCRDLVQLPVAA